ncbi:hypothetical protein ACFQW6_02885 [Nocardioides sp. GCM10028917]|uniref:hypothetical protein n=1 Tax=Nocardioides sp. GCM10028917 TaxID=3273408 RepID=UPI0036173D60
MATLTPPTGRSGVRESRTVHVAAPRHSWDLPPAPVPGGAPPRRVRRLLGVVGLLGLVLALVALGLNLSLTSRLDRIDGAFDGLAARPAAAPGETILLVATRPGGAADVPWLAGEQSIEGLMLVEIGANGANVRVESLPLAAGIGAAVASSPPSSSVKAVESWSGRRVDHLTAVDWRAFVQLAAHNGVDTAYSYGSSASVQHDYLREVLEGTLHAELRKQPLNLYRALITTASGTAIDDEWSVLELDLLLLSLRNLRSQHIEFSNAQPR